LAVGYNWAGNTIIRDTVIWGKRAVIGYQNIYIPTDIRAWLSSQNSEVIKRSLQDIGLPSAKGPGTFDLRAWRIWDYVARSVEYVSDKKSCGMEDFWLFPEETVMIRKGDCEDSSFLLATLLLASGISQHCIRVVLGRVISPDGPFGHAWVVYLNEEGVWCILESTLDAAPARLVPADPFSRPGNNYQYEPKFCLNDAHLWSMSQDRTPIADYLKARGQMPEKKIAERFQRASSI
jgi:transglutaminase-like putative cysteine protease